MLKAGMLLEEKRSATSPEMLLVQIDCFEKAREDMGITRTFNIVVVVEDETVQIHDAIRSSEGGTV